MIASASVPTTVMKAPAPLRTAILFDDTDAAALTRAAALRDWLDPAWFAPELWPLAGGPGTTPARPRPGRFIGRMRLAWQFWSHRPAVLYALSSRAASWGVFLGLLFGVPVVTVSPQAGVARLARLFRGRYAWVGSDAGEPPAKTAAPCFDDVQNVLLEVLQMGSSWTTTRRSQLPMEFALGTGFGASAAADRIEERGVGRPNRSVRFVGRPSMTVFLPDREIASGTAIVICPGGGYAGVTIDKEGHDVARWLASKGVAGMVLKYRLPRSDRGGTDLPWPMTDLDAALALTRAHAAAWGIRADRIGVMGFSAGGHMAAWASRTAAPPAFAILVYPVISMDRGLTHAGSRTALLGRSPSAAMIERYSFERGVTRSVCPTFVVHARDDTVAKPANSLLYLEALRAAHVPAQALLYDHGGHGFGLGICGGEVANWPEHCLEWVARTTAMARNAGADRADREGAASWCCRSGRAPAHK